jgi:thioredoxin-related protein
MRAFLALCFCLILGGPLVAGEARPVQLVFFERSGCVWCQRFDREVAPIYEKSVEGQRYPLKRINLDRESTGHLQLREPVRFTPTFVLLQGEAEVGRITGFIDDATFWGLLDKLLASLPVERAKTQ